MKSIEDEIILLRKSRVEFAVCTVVAAHGSTPRDIGAKMVVTSDGKITGTIGGGELEKQVIADALPLIRKEKSELKRYDLLRQLNMCCGGTADIFIQAYPLVPRLYIFGAGHVGNALAHMASSTGFDVYMIDPRDEWINALHNENVSKMKLDYSLAMSALPFDRKTFTCIMTFSHPADREILAYCVHQPHAYLGMIGSRRKVAITRKIFLESGFATPAELDAIDMPMGIEIGAEGPAEIAVSILARLIAVKNQSGVSASPFSEEYSALNS